MLVPVSYTHLDVYKRQIPIGNGHIAGMIFGGTIDDKIQLNDETLWYRGKCDRNNPDSYKYLDKIRELLKIGKVKDVYKRQVQAFG